MCVAGLIFGTGSSSTGCVHLQRRGLLHDGRRREAAFDTSMRAWATKGSLRGKGHKGLRLARVPHDTVPCGSSSVGLEPLWSTFGVNRDRVSGGGQGEQSGTRFVQGTNDVPVSDGRGRNTVPSHHTPSLERHHM